MTAFPEFEHGFKRTVKGDEVLKTNAKFITSKERQCLLLINRTDDTSKCLCQTLLTQNMVNRLIAHELIVAVADNVATPQSRETLAAHNSCNQSQSAYMMQPYHKLNKQPLLALHDFQVRSEFESVKSIMIRCIDNLIDDIQGIVNLHLLRAEIELAVNMTTLNRLFPAWCHAMSQLNTHQGDSDRWIKQVHERLLR